MLRLWPDAAHLPATAEAPEAAESGSEQTWVGVCSQKALDMGVCFVEGALFTWVSRPKEALRCSEAVCISLDYLWGSGGLADSIWTRTEAEK